MLGAHLILQLVKKGYTVKAIRRHSSSLEVVEKVFKVYHGGEYLPQIEWVQGDVTDYFSLEKASEGIDLIYHVAGFISFHAKDKQKLEHVNIQGTANVVNAALHNNVKKIIYVSSVSALGGVDSNELINETTPWKNSPLNTHYAVTKQAGEREIWRGGEEGLQVLVVNPGLILGYGDWNSGTGQVVKRIAEGQSFYTTGCNGWVDVRDTVRAMVTLDELDIHGEKFILIAENVPFKRGFTVLANHLGSKVPTVKAGKTLMKLAVWSEGIRSWFTGKEPLVTRETIMTASLFCEYDNAKIKKSIGFEFTPFEETVREVSALYLTEKSGSPIRELVSP